MSQAVRDFSKSFLADNAVAQYLVVKVTTTGCDVATANTDAIIGVSQSPGAAATEQVTVQLAGTTKVTAGGTITAGDWVTATTAGKVITDSTDKHGVVGRALQSAVTGDVFEILLVPGLNLSV